MRADREAGIGHKMQLGGENGKIFNSQGAPQRSEPGETAICERAFRLSDSRCALMGDGCLNSTFDLFSVPLFSPSFEKKLIK